MSNIGIFGGTFNPIHNGHIRLVKTVMDSIDFEKVIVMPDRLPPHKQADSLASAQDRLCMCRLAFEDTDRVEVCDWELLRSGKSYTVYTIRHFRMLYPNDTLWLIMGSDMLLSFDRWYAWEEILKNANIVCISRKSEDTPEVLSQKADELMSRTGARIVTVQAQPFEISSERLRESIKKMQDTSCYFPKKIVQYICEHNLYK